MLSTRAHNNENLLLSDEAFSRMKYNDNNLSLLLTTIQERFHVRLVLYYRQYFSWFLSQYNEHYKPLPRREFLQKWPGEGGKRIRPFVEYYTQYQKEVGVGKSHQSAADKGNYQLAGSRLNVHPIVYLKNRWTDPNLAAPVQDVVIMDMHEDEGGVTFQFIQKAVSPELATAFQKHQQQHSNTMPLRKNPSLNLDFDIMSVQAREQGLFPKHETLARRRVAVFAEQILQKNMSLAEMPHICLDEDQLQHFLN